MRIMTNVIAALALTALVFVIANVFGDMVMPPPGPVVGASAVKPSASNTGSGTNTASNMGADAGASSSRTQDQTQASSAGDTTAAPSSDASSSSPAPAAETPAPVAAKAVEAGDSVRGKKVFRKCIGCHSYAKGDKPRVGPNLWGIVGRKKASADGFRYSPALQALGGVWSEEDIDALISNPRGFVRGTKMTFAGLKDPQDRADVIAFLSTLKD